MNVYAFRLESFDGRIQSFLLGRQVLIAVNFEAVHVELTIKPLRVEVIKVTIMDQENSMLSVTFSYAIGEVLLLISLLTQPITVSWFLDSVGFVFRFRLSTILLLR